MRSTHSRSTWLRIALLAACIVPFFTLNSQAAESVGEFSDHQDVGETKHRGSASYDESTKTYTVSGGGANMWFDTDAFHILWKKANGDVSLTADIRFPESGGDPHRKACLMMRKSLEPDSAYIDVALHGDGLTSLQYRATDGGPTQEVQANVMAPRRLRLVKQGTEYHLEFASSTDADLRHSGATQTVDLGDEFYVGLVVCAHDNERLEKAEFANVVLETDVRTASNETSELQSTLEQMEIASTDRRVVYSARVHFEAPNWSPDGSFLLFNQQGRLYRIPVEGGEPREIDSGFARRINNDHGISPDGQTIVISDQTRGQSQIYTLPITGGEPKLITEKAPSYWHGWSPDGSTLAYCAERDDEYDIYTIPVHGGEETRLTSETGLDDGPDYSPDGRHIYFNSERTGRMEIWRIDSDGANPTQLTDDEYHNWFPHPSPDGKWVVFLTYEPDVEGHPENQNVMLRLMSVNGGEIRVLAKLFGGQGTINVPSWSPDSKSIAFVSYRLVPAEVAE